MVTLVLVSADWLVDKCGATANVSINESVFLLLFFFLLLLMNLFLFVCTLITL